MNRTSAISSRSTILIDGGTTNTRAWLLSGEKQVAALSADIGVRDTARDGNRERFDAGVTGLISALVDVAASADLPRPQRIVAAGMITSGLGLAEVPHVAAPAGVQELVAGSLRIAYPGITDLEVLLVPGVRTGPPHCSLLEIGTADVMRGEETLCVGLVNLSYLAPRDTLLNLGSHWKAVTIDDEGRVAGSRTSMTGELIHTAQADTILAAAVSQGRPAVIDSDWFERGMAESRRSGIGRALFCVRLLEQRSDGTPEERLAFLLGAYVAADLEPLVLGAHRGRGGRVAISGGGPLAPRIAQVIAGHGIEVELLSPTEVEEGMIAGLNCVAIAAAE
jgi:2-dehydro-3-deoxygalactonokinase